MVRRLKTFFTSDFGLALIIAVAWQLIITVIFVALTNEWSSPLDYTTQWDGGWYLEIIRDKYVTNTASAVFYPLFPFTIFFLSEATFHLLSYPLLALFLNTVCLWFAIAAIFTVTKFYTTKYYKLSALFFLAAPAAIFMNFFYTEALFVAIAFWAYAFALKQKWFAMALLLALLTASRLPSLLFIGLCVLEFLRAHDWNIKKSLNLKALYFLFTPLGFILYGIYLHIVRSDFLAMFHGYDANSDWEYHALQPNILRTIGRIIIEIIRALVGGRPFNNDILINHTLPIICLGILAITSLYLIFKIRGRGLPLGMFGLVSIIFFTLNNNLVSVHRYTLACLGIYIALTLFYAQSRRFRIIAIILALVMAVCQMLLIIFYSLGAFIG